MKEKICVVVDSGSDLNKEMIEDLDIVSLPLRIIIENREFVDNETISREEIFATLTGDYKNLTPKQKSNISDQNLVEGHALKISTSLPTPQDILNTYTRLKEEGYTHIIAVAISSGLSGTYNTMSLMKDEIEGITIETIDTKNISLASGYIAYEAAKRVKKGESFDEIGKACHDAILKRKSKVFFTVGNLEYLRKGGRIGLVASSAANLLNIKPIISCNDDGIYYTIKKGRGYRKMISQMIDLAVEYVGAAEKYRLEIVNADSKENFQELINAIKNKLPSLKDINVVNITPALAIHTGPEALGITVFIND